MNRRAALFSIAVLLIVFVTGCYVAPIQPTPSAQWVPVTLTATGGGAPPARSVNQAQARLLTERAAKVDALRNLLEEAYGVTIHSNTTVREYITKNDTIRARVDAYIRGARVIDKRYLDDGGVEVEMEIILGYEFRRIFP